MNRIRVSLARIAPQKIKWLTRGFWRGATRYEITLRVNHEVNSNLHVEQPALSERGRYYDARCHAVCLCLRCCV